jgi:integrase
LAGVAELLTEPQRAVAPPPILQAWKSHHHRAWSSTTTLAPAAADDQDAALYLTAAYTGLRLGELSALCWRDVDFAGQRLHVRRSWSPVA